METIKDRKSLKSELKLEAAELRKTKNDTKELQRKNEIAGNLQYKIIKLKRRYRHRHIAYSMMKGRKYKEIERKCRKDNKPDHNLIREIINAYTPQEENVRLSA